MGKLLMPVLILAEVRGHLSLTLFTSRQSFWGFLSMDPKCVNHLSSCSGFKEGLFQAHRKEGGRKEEGERA